MICELVETVCKGRSCVDGDGMFFKAEVRIKSNTKEFKSSRRRKEGVCNFYGRWGDRVFRRADTQVQMNMNSDFCGFS